MNGKLIDGRPVVARLGSFLIGAKVSPRVANLLIAWGGAVLLGWHNSSIRREPKSGAVRERWQPR